MRKVLGNLTYGLYALGVEAGGRKNMCIVNTAIQVSSEPAKITVALSKNNFSHDLVKEAKKFSISILDQETDTEIFGRMGFSSGKDKDKFENFPYGEDELKNPYLNQALGVLSAKVTDMVDVGSHTLFVGEVVQAIALKEGTPLTYTYYKQIKKGTVPKNAPTYAAATEEPKKQESTTKRYRCAVCGYIYQENLPFEQLAEDYKCPVCNAPKAAFKIVE